MNNREEKKLDKNYFLALALSMLVLVGYSFLLQKLRPQTPAPQNNAAQQITATSESKTNQIQEKQNGETVGEAVLEKSEEPQVTRYQNRLYDVELSTLGGTVTRLIFKGENRQSGISNEAFYEGEAQAPGIFGIRFSNEDADLSKTRFKMKLIPGRSGAYEFIYEKVGSYRINKKFYFGEKEPIIALDVSIENLSPEERRYPIVFHYGLNADVKHEQDKAMVQAVAKAQKIMEADHGKLFKKAFLISEEIVWAGLIKKYFALLVKPEIKAVSQETRLLGHNMETDMALEPLTLAPGASTQKQIFIYAGPQRYEVLSAFNSGFEDLLSRGIFGAFKILLLKSLKFFNQYSHNFGWAIILMTLVIKGLFSPLTNMSFKSMKKMQALQPKLKSLQERYKNDATKLNQSMMELYKKNKVNPLGGCLPMLLQIPIFIAFYQMLNDAIELKGAPFIGWIKDLAEPDRLWAFPTILPFIGSSFNILPLLMVGSMVLQQRMTPQMSTSPEQAKMMNIMMPIMFGFMFYNMPSGLVLYWLMNNTFSIIQQGLVKRMIVIPHHDDEDEK